MKYLPVGYFVVLFVILGSFIAGSTYTQTAWLEVFMADTLSPSQPNMALLWVRDPDSKRDMSDYEVVTEWNFVGGGTLSPPEWTPIHKTGRTLAQLPDISHWEDPNADLRNVNLSFEIWQNVEGADRGKYLKGFEMPLQGFSFVPEPKAQPIGDIGDGVFSAFAPAALMYGESSEVQVITIGPDGPYRGPVAIEQVHGLPAKFPASLETEGIARFPLEIQSPVDLRLVAGEREFFASFTPGMRPIAATSKQALMTPDSAPKLHIESFGTMPTVTIDMFDGKAWIGRKQYQPREVRKADLSSDDGFQYQFHDKPGILYARVNNSDVGSEDNAQTMAFIAAGDKMSQKEQAAFAVKSLSVYGMQHPEIPHLESMLRESSKNAIQVRDYALAQLALHHHANIHKQLGTDKIDRELFDQQKEAAKRRSNRWLIVWFLVGIVGSLVFILRRRSQNRSIRIANQYAGEDYIPEPTRGMGGPVLLLVILFIGFMVSLYYMMQIL